jgi:phosphoribosylanthranilate isomerase
MATRVKVCGFTRPDDLALAIDLGAWAIGLNFVPSSPRAVPIETAANLARLATGRALVVAVVADAPREFLERIANDVAIDAFQLHGSEVPGDLDGLPRPCFKALRVATADDVTQAARFPGDYVLVDAKVDGALGGTGRTFDWQLVRDLAATRRVILAGGLAPHNVARAIATAHPFAVDVASGIETAPGIKDPVAMRAFFEAVCGDAG